MIDFLFMDDETEEFFIVQERDLDTAFEIASEKFENFSFIRELTEQEAEDLGYDTF